MVPLPGIIMREHRAVSHRFMVLQGLRVTFLVESSPERLPDDHVLRDVALGQGVVPLAPMSDGPGVHLDAAGQPVLAEAQPPQRAAELTSGHGAERPFRSTAR